MREHMMILTGDAVMTLDTAKNVCSVLLNFLYSF